jgi:hypothetical protein
VLKEIITMFIIADSGGHVRSIAKEFILNKESQILSNDIQVFLYSNASPFKRLLGHCIVYDPILGIQNWSEINFKPFGYFYTENSTPPNGDMLNITAFKDFFYDQEVSMQIITKYLSVESPEIGTYF